MSTPRGVTIKTDEEKIRVNIELINIAVQAKGLHVAESAVVIAKDLTSQMEEQFKAAASKAAAKKSPAKVAKTEKSK